MEQAQSAAAAVAADIARQAAEERAQKESEAGAWIAHKAESGQVCRHGCARRSGRLASPGCLLQGGGQQGRLHHTERVTAQQSVSCS